VRKVTCIHITSTSISTLRGQDTTRRYTVSIPKYYHTQRVGYHTALHSLYTKVLSHSEGRIPHRFTQSLYQSIITLGGQDTTPLYTVSIPKHYHTRRVGYHTALRSLYTKVLSHSEGRIPHRATQSLYQSIITLGGQDTTPLYTVSIPKHYHTRRVGYHTALHNLYQIAAWTMYPHFCASQPLTGFWCSSDKVLWN